MKKLFIILLIFLFAFIPSMALCDEEYIDGVDTVGAIVTGSAIITGGTIDGTTIGATTPSTGVFTTLSVSQNFQPTKGSDVASANGVTLGNGNLFDITGTTTINTIATKGIGTIVVLEFDGILQLTHSNDLFLPTAANITTAAGDIATFYEYAAADWRCMNYLRADGTALVGSGAADDTAYDAGTWDANSDAATKNAIRDKIETLALESVVGTSIGNGLRLDGTVLKADRDFRTLPFDNAAEQTAFSEANMLAYSAIDNQGAGEETDVILVAVSYPIKFAVETSEAFSIELCPPAGELFHHDGTDLHANDCILSSATVGASFMVKRRQIADASWIYHTYTIQGVNTDDGAAD